ncbi:MAG TPA: PhnD/SsuA/transferrin family substrate-binding protein, partial [Usitatibacter sp.]|nr:PhnD/SsuA/transferrin family substrate-binding protein [Usitatibacter sp.]
NLRVIDSTPWMPIPLLVAAPAIDPGVVDRIRAHLLEVHRSPDYAGLLEPVLVSRFVAPDVESYQATEAMRRRAEEARYATIR